MPIKKEKIEKKLEEVQKDLIALQQNVNQEINTLNNKIANQVFLVNKAAGKIEALEENYKELGITVKEKDEKIETYQTFQDSSQCICETLGHPNGAK